MEYKVLIKLIVPEIDEIYEMYIPVNKTVGNICYLLCSIVNNLSKVYSIRNNCILINRNTGIKYNRSLTIKNTDIRNGSELVLY